MTAHWWHGAHRVNGALPVRGLGVTAADWLQCAADLAASGGRLLALWAVPGTPGTTPAIVRAAFAIAAGVLVLELTVADDEREGHTGGVSGAGSYPGLEAIFPCASRMQRAAFDLCGVRSTDPDRRPWLRHAAWPASWFPLQSNGHVSAGVATVDDYRFLRVQGDGIHEIPVGPVHAGIIEPGHFRFSVVGEKVLRLETRLGYTHKGIELRFAEIGLFEGHRLAARVSGDSAVAYSWAYCQALEGLAGCTISPRAAWLRGLMLESERIANHLGDLGALGNDAGFAFGLAQFSRLKEHWLRAVDALFGRRYLMDAIVPGGTAVDVSPHALQDLAAHAARLVGEVRSLRQIYDEHDGVRDRFATTGSVSPALAARLGIIGLSGRASSQAYDARVDWPCAPYDDVAPQIVVHTDGDVAARVAVRFDEVLESCRLVERIAAGLPNGPSRTEVAAPTAAAFGVGVIEGWRGPVLVALDAGPGDRVRRCHPHDPSWQNWPVLEHAVIGNIVPDFPLINKSFNLSYSGQDL
jgi:Ni,Fe-hydrogenase III large subunit